MDLPGRRCLDSKQTTTALRDCSRRPDISEWGVASEQTCVAAGGGASRMRRRPHSWAGDRVCGAASR
jgi:hypothetical protein